MTEKWGFVQRCDPLSLAISLSKGRSVELSLTAQLGTIQLGAPLRGEAVGGEVLVAACGCSIRGGRTAQP